MHPAEEMVVRNNSRMHLSVEVKLNMISTVESLPTTQQAEIREKQFKHSAADCSWW